MRRWIELLASLKLNVALLVFVLLVLAGGTIVEALYGTQVARSIYFAPWFLGALALLGINLLCSLWVRWPWGRFRIGFVLTHGSMVLILLGSLMTYMFKVEGQLALWEGQESNVFVDAGTPGEVASHTLPFSVRLDAFEIDYHPGTRRPAMFRSRVQVNDPSIGEPWPAVIEMNHELSYGGYKFFQTSYQQTDGREMSVLTVSRDRGQPVVFVGYVLLIIGMITVFATRIVQRRGLGVDVGPLAPPPGGTGSGLKIVGLWLLALVLTGMATPVAQLTSVVPDAATLETLRRLPVQHDGRVMPLDTLAREAVWRVTGNQDLQGIDPATVALGWSFAPAVWSQEPIIPLGSRRLATELGFPTGTRHASLQQLATNPRTTQLIREARSQADLDQPLSGLQEDARELEGRMLWMQGLMSKRLLRVMPASENAADPWAVPPRLESVTDLVEINRWHRFAPPAGYPSDEDIERELLYNRVRPSRLAWWVLAFAAVVSLVAWARPQRWLEVLATVGLATGFGVMTWGLALRWQIASRIPASNMYESMLFLAWGVGLFALVARVTIRGTEPATGGMVRLVVVNATLISTLAMVLVDLLPLDPFIHPMPPTLSGTPWLAIHVPITMVSYSVFALGMLAAHIQIGTEIFAPARRELAARMNDLLYWYMHVGSILLAAGIFTGSIWAASSWGRYWGWDPKEVWSLIALLAYMAILHGRFDRLIGPFGTAAMSIVAFWTILMTYIGVNFVLTAGLHSYGFGQSSVTTWMAVLALAEILFLTAGLIAHNRRRSTGTGLEITS
ncbi:MAG: cytochrome c biogenesis protein CcsA [Thermoanaerobaculia bacterium]